MIPTPEKVKRDLDTALIALGSIITDLQFLTLKVRSIAAALEVNIDCGAANAHSAHGNCSGHSFDRT